MEALEVAGTSNAVDGPDLLSGYIVISEALARNIIIASYREKLAIRDSAEIALFIERAPMFETGYIEVFRLGLTRILDGDTAAGLAALDASLTLEPDYAPALLLTARINDFSGNLTPAALFYMRTLLSREPAAASEDHLLIWLLNALEGIDDSSDFAAEKGVRQLHCTPPEGGAGLTNGISRLRKTIAEKKENLTVSETWFGDLSVDHTDEELATALFMAAMPGYNGSQAVATADSTIARVRHSHAALLAEMLKDRPIQSTDSRNDAANPETDRTEQR